MLMRIFVVVMLVIAVVVGILAQILPRDQLLTLFMFRDFFEVTLPILAFAALIKYLFSCHVHCKISREDKTLST